MKKFVHHYAYLFLVAGVIIVLDQWTKGLVRQNLQVGDIWSPWPWLTPYARIVHWYNTGAAFGIFQGFGNVFMVLSILISIAILFYFPRVPRSDWFLRLAMGMQFGGAVGNLIDRLTIGHVTDFISIGTFPVWNIADASITVGVVVLMFGLWLQERQQARIQKAGGIEAQPQMNDES